MSGDHSHTERAVRLSEKTIQLGHEFLSALFMGVRTAQIHDPSNAAFANTVQRVLEAASTLFAATGGFDVQMVDESFFLNGVRLRFQGKSHTSMRVLRRICESQQLGGFRMHTPPTYDGIRRMISLFATGARTTLEDHRKALEEFEIGVFGVQRLADGQGPVKIDRRVFAVHSYAKLILALREHAAIIAHIRTHGPDPSVRPRIRVVRVIQDLAELCDDRLDLLLKLSSNATGAPADELAAANTCVLSLVLGHALELHRRDLGDIGMAALFSLMGRRIMDAQAEEAAVNAASLAKLLTESGVGLGLYTRAMVLSEQVRSPTASMEGRRAHPFARILRVSAAYAKLVTGLELPNGEPLSPLGAVRAIRADRSRWLDPRLVDLLVNLLRVFPRGTPVVLDSGHHALVSKANLRNWDCPEVRIAGNPPATMDLAPRNGGRQVQVAFTQAFLGTEPAMGVVATRVEAPSPTPNESSPPAASRPRHSPIPSLTALAQGAGPAAPSVRPVVTAPAVVAGQLSAAPAEMSDPWRSGSHISASADLEGELGFGPGRPPPGPATGTVSNPSQNLDLAADLLDDEPLQPPVTPPAHDEVPTEPVSSVPSPSDELIPILDPIVKSSGSVPPVAPAGTAAAAPQASLFGDSASNRLIGTYLAGKYRILHKLGEGGMGAVFTANQEPIDRKVAVKVLLPSLAGDEVAVQRFEREAKAISRMRHPNTVTIYDFGKTAANELYIVMEYLEGETLADLIRREDSVAPDRAARIIRQACASLSEAHDAGIVHRDLKPDNIFLTSLGSELDWVKVLDFGLAKLADNETTARLTQQGKVFGTPRYMSPEQAQGKSLDARSDLYTLAVVLYEMLTGCAMFETETLVALLVKHISEPPRSFGVARPDLTIDPELERVVMKALSKEADDRYPSVEAFAGALEPFSYPKPARPDSAVAQSAASAPPSAQAGQASGLDVASEDLDDLLSDFLRDLTPLDHLAEGPANPFADFTPAPGSKDKF